MVLERSIVLLLRGTDPDTDRTAVIVRKVRKARFIHQAGYQPAGMGYGLIVDGLGRAVLAENSHPFENCVQEPWVVVES